MVATNFYHTEFDLRWIAYLGLSVCINMLIISAIQFDPPTNFIPSLASIKINLKAPAISKQPLVSEPYQETKKRDINALKKKVVVEKSAKQQVFVEKHPLVQPTQKRANETQSEIPTVSETRIKNPTTFIEEEVVEVSDSAPLIDTTKHEALGTQAEQSDLPRLTNGATENTVYEARYRKKTTPIYPSRAFELGQQGNVTLHAKIMPSGVPDEIKIVRSSGHRLLDSAALAAVRKWEFEPTMINGNAIVSWVRVPVNFVIQ